MVSKLNGRSIDDHYTAAYYPDLKLNDTVNNVVVQVKPSVVVLAAVVISITLRRQTYERIERGLVSEARLAAELLSHRTAAVSSTELQDQARALARDIDARHFAAIGRQVLHVVPRALQQLTRMGMAEADARRWLEAQEPENAAPGAEQAGGEPLEVWPENWPAWVLFCEMETQWRVGPGGATGLDYTPLFARMDRLGLTGPEWEQRFADIREIEAAALVQMREGRDTP